MKKEVCGVLLGAVAALQCQLARVEMKPEAVGAFSSLVLLRQDHYLERTPLNVVWGLQSFLQMKLEEIQGRLLGWLGGKSRTPLTAAGPEHRSIHREIGYPAEARHSASWNRIASLRLVRPDRKEGPPGGSVAEREVREKEGFLILCFEAGESKKLIDIGLVEGPTISAWRLPDDYMEYCGSLGIVGGENFALVEAYGNYRVGHAQQATVHLYTLNLHLFSRFYDGNGVLVYEHAGRVFDIPVFKEQEVNSRNYETIALLLVQRMLGELKLEKQDSPVAPGDMTLMPGPGTPALLSMAEGR